MFVAKSDVRDLISTHKLMEYMKFNSTNIHRRMRIKSFDRYILGIPTNEEGHKYQNYGNPYLQQVNHD